MADEELFPRGKPQRFPKGKQKRPRYKEDEDHTEYLFKERKKIRTEKEEPKKVKKREQREDDVLRSHQVKKNEKELLETAERVGVEYLHHKNIQEGMLLLGMIKEIHELELMISLPHCNTGYVQATRISSVYTKLIQQHLSDDSEDNNLTPLSDMFHVGQLVVCSVPSSSSTAIQLTLEPTVVNKYLTASSFFVGQVVVGAVKSEEDHGFMIDIGKPKFSSFLPLKDVGNAKLCPGSVARFVITAVRGEGTILILSLDEKQLSKSLIKKEHGISLDSLQPGMCGLFNPKSIAKGGITGTFLDFNGSLCVLDNNMTNVVAQMNKISDDGFGKKSKKFKTAKTTDVAADKDLSNKKRKYGNLVKACVLFVYPFSKHVCVSSSKFLLNSEIRKKTHQNYEESFPVGYKCEAKITKFVKGLGAMLKIEKGRDVVGFCTSKHLSDNKLENLNDIFMPGKSVSACVIHSLALDGVVVLSLKKSIVECEFLTYDSIIPGMLVDCKIKCIEEHGLFVALGKNTYSPVKGMVMNQHMADVNLTHPEKKFTAGDVISCKVLSVDKVRKRVRLTHKRTMLKSKLPTVTSYEQLKVGDIVHGYIASIKKFGVFVNFYNNVFGLVPNSELSTDFVENPDQVYFIGQVMKCRVIRLDIQSEQVKLSFILKAGAKKNITSPLCNKIVDVELAMKTEKGFEVLIMEEDKSKEQWSSAFLSRMHLSDFPSLANAWHSSLTVGSVLKDCMVLGKRRPYHVTKKKSIIDECQKRELTFSDLKQDLTVRGFIRYIVPYGVFVYLPGDLVGLCPKSKMADRYLISSEGYFHEGQSVIANVVEVDQEKKRFIVSLQVSDCSNQMDDQDAILNNYLTEDNELKKTFDTTWFDVHTVGSQLTAHLTEMKYEDGSQECEVDGLPEGVVAKLIDVDDDVEIQGDMKVTILYTDLLKKTIILSGDLKLLNSKTEKKGKKPTVLGTVKHINEDVSVLTAAIGNNLDVGLTLTRKHPNHPMSEDNWPWKSDEKLQFKFLAGSKFGVPLYIPLSENKDNATREQGTGGRRVRSDSEASDSTASIAVSFGNLHVGLEVEGVISSVRKTNLLVRISESETEGGYKGQPVTGRLHISETQEEFASGIISMKKYKPWSKIKCKVIGFRDVRTHNFLAITKKTSTRCVLELSLRSVHNQLALTDYNTGDSVTAFASEFKNDQLRVEVSPSIHGTVPLLLLSDNPNATLKSYKPKKRSSAWKCVVVKKYEHTLSLAGDGAMIDKETGNNIFEFRKGCVTNGKIRRINVDNVVVALPHRATGKLHIANTSDEFQDQPFKELKVDDIIRCAVIECPSDQSLVLAMRKSHMLPEGSSDSVVDKEVVDGKDLCVGDFVRGFIKSCSGVGVFVIISPTITGRVELKKISKYFIKDTDLLKEILPSGKLVKCKIVGISQIENKVSLSLLESDTGCPDLVPVALGLPLRHGKEKEKKRKAVGTLVDKFPSGSKKRKIELKKKYESKKKEQAVDDTDSGLDEGLDSGESYVKTPTPGNVKIVSHNEAGSGEEDPGFVWDVSFAEKSSSSAKNCSDSDDDDDSDEEKELMVPKKKTKRELEREKEVEEEDLRKKEEQLCSDNLPQTAVEWERLILTNPQNSMLWVRYMAFHLHATEVDKARVVAEQALKTINFREEQEKLNIWVAFLNLENMFGTEDTLENVLERAMQQNDPLKVQTRLVSILEKSGKHEQAEEVYEKMFRKYRRNKDVPIMYMTHLMQRGKRESANDIMKRTLQSLERKHHLEIISKYGQLEYKHGDPEQGRIVFENALSNYPKRSDIWSVYIDMLIKVNKLDEARNVFERVTTLNLSTKKMKTFFKRFVEFEVKYGTDESVAEVRQKAMDFVESKMSNDQME